MIGRWPEPSIDHKNMDKADNRWDNLREATYSENCRNKKVNSNNALGFKGVIKRQGHQFRHAPYEAYIRPRAGERVYLGRFETAQEAHAAYSAAAAKLHGDFART
jgi:hypothetical protein